MVESYWDLYVAYIDKCVRDNWVNDIDPHHYRMEWNHFLPKSIFGDQPIGQWLTFRQHAIASALQSLAFKRNCLCPWHKSYLPSTLLELSWPYFCKSSKENGEKGCVSMHTEKDKNGKSVNAVKAGIAAAVVLHSEKDENGKSVNAVKGGRKGGIKGAATLHAEKDENGKSVMGVENGKRLHAKKDELGRSVVSVKAAASTNSQVWESTKDGFRSTSGNVARHNKANGWDPSARIRVF